MIDVKNGECRRRQFEFEFRKTCSYKKAGIIEIESRIRNAVKSPKVLSNMWVFL